MNNRKNILDYLYTVMTRFGIKFANLIFFLLIAKYLTVTELAYYGLFFTSALLFSVFADLGLRNSAAKYLGTAEKCNESALINTLFAFFIFVLFFSVVIFVCLNKIFEFDISSNTAILFMVTSFSLTHIRMMQGVFLGSSNVKQVNISDSFSRMFLILFSVYIFISGGVTLEFSLLSLAISQLSSSIYISVYLYVKYQKKTKFSFLNKADSLAIFKSGLIFMLCVLAMNLFKRHHLYVLERYTNSDSGLFFGFFRLSEIFIEIALAISMVLFSKTTKSKDLNNSLMQAAIVAKYSIYLLFPLLILGGVFSSSIISVFLNHDYLVFKSSFIFILLASFFGVFWAVLFPSLSVLLNPLYLMAVFFISTILSLLGYMLCSLYYGVGILQSSIIFMMSNIFLNIGILTLISIKLKGSLSLFLLPKKEELLIIFRKVLKTK